MKGLIEKILERLEKERIILLENNLHQAIALNFAKGIVQEVAEEYEDGWIPIDEKLPPDDSYILLSFSNFSVSIVGRYEEDEDGGGNFFAGDEDEPLISQDLFVNAWMPLPKPYEEIQYTANNK